MVGKILSTASALRAASGWSANSPERALRDWLCDPVPFMVCTIQIDGNCESQDWNRTSNPEGGMLADVTW